MKKNKVLVTGASGFIGKSLLLALNENNISYRPVYRRHSNYSSQLFLVDEINGQTNWGHIIEECNVVIHLAGIAHKNIKLFNFHDEYSNFKNVNYNGTMNLAFQAHLKGVKKFIFMSSINVNGDETFPNMPIKSDSPVNPKDSYSQSKLEAENELLKLYSNSSMDIIIIRPVLVYGKNMKGNLYILSKLIEFRIPLPFENVNNKRDLVSLDNLVSLIIACINCENIKNKILIVSDNKKYTTKDIINIISDIIGVRPILFKFPCKYIKYLLILLGLKSISKKLFGSLEVDIDATCDALNWNPK